VSELKPFFEPKSVVLIGSSKICEKVGMTSPQLFENVIHNMRRLYKGTTLVVDIEKENNKKKLEKLPETPELGVVMLPPSQSIKQSEKWSKMGVKAFVMITGGYKNRQRRQLLKLRDQYGVRILGPNTIMGVINTKNGLNTTFERDIMPSRGKIAVISQSGGVGACLIDWACFYKIGISKFVFVGDKIDVNDVELLGYLNRDRQTSVICLYIEGLENGREFVKVAREVVKRKPVLALKGGVTKEAAERALSHTASIAGSHIIFKAAIKKAGVISAGNLEELMNNAVALASQSPLSGDNIAVVSNVGGPAILAADAIAKNGLQLAVLSEKTKSEIQLSYPGVDASNPIDLIADARADRYSKVLDSVLSDPNVDGVIVINMLKSCFFEPEDALVIAEVAKKYPNKPVVDVPGGGEDFTLVYNFLEKTSIPVYNLPEKAVLALKTLRTYFKQVENLKATPQKRRGK
jgi:acetyltransferase